MGTKTKEVLFTCNYDEKSFESYKGIEVQYLHYGNKVLDIINTGDVYKDLETARDKYKGHSAMLCSSIDNYTLDLRMGKELLSKDG